MDEEKNIVSEFVRERGFAVILAPVPPGTDPAEHRYYIEHELRLCRVSLCDIQGVVYDEDIPVFWGMPCEE